MSGESRSATQTSVLAGEDWQVTCHLYKWTTPILAITAGSATICFSIRDREEMPSPGVAFARELARCAEQFAAECERLHALHSHAEGHSGTQEPERLAAAGPR